MHLTWPDDHLPSKRVAGSSSTSFPLTGHPEANAPPPPAPEAMIYTCTIPFSSDWPQNITEISNEAAEVDLVAYHSAT